MFIYLDRCFIKAFLIIICFLSSFAYAADDGDWLLQRQITIEKAQNDHARKVYGTSARIIRENASISSATSQNARDIVRRSIAVDVPTASKVGGSMFKRVSSYAKAPGVQMIGVLAVTQLIESIGWVMEDGIYVKKIPQDSEEPDNSQFAYSANNQPNDSRYICYGASSCKSAINVYTPGLPNLNCYDDDHSPPHIHCSYQFPGSSPSEYVLTPFLNPKYEKPPADKVVPLTPALLGAAMLGTGYSDPDPQFDNTRVNTGDYTGVKEIYEHDPTGIGDELADAMDDKLKNAKPTDDTKSSYIGDPKYDSKTLSDGDVSSDRSWEDDAGEATGETTPTLDPTTGEATGYQSISFKFPVFCEWASSMCEWYDDWKKSDQIYKDHMKKTEEHQDSEKSFWQTVKDWFDWTKEEPQKSEDDNYDIQDESDQDLLDKMQSVKFDESSYCPSDINVPVNFNGLGSSNLTISYSPLCAIAKQIRPVVIMLAWILAAYIVTGRNMKGGADS